MWQDLVDFFFPKKCVVCRELETNLCEECKKGLSFTEFQICPMCGERSPMGWTHERCKKKYGMDGLISIYDYEDEGVKKVVDGIKYDFNQELVGDLLKNFVFEVGKNFDAVVPVPLYFYRENWRGFNQASVIGESVASKIDINSVDLLRRVRNTVQQVKMKNRKEREENICDAFALDRRPACRSGRSPIVDIGVKSVLLVDDVFTSGADMRECAKVLKKAGVKVVWGFALAH